MTSWVFKEVNLTSFVEVLWYFNGTKYRTSKKLSFVIYFLAPPGRAWATTTFSVPSLSLPQRAPHPDQQRWRRPDQSFAISPDPVTTSTTTSRAKSVNTSTATATVEQVRWDGLLPTTKTCTGEALFCRRVSTEISWIFMALLLACAKWSSFYVFPGV